MIVIIMIIAFIKFKNKDFIEIITIVKQIKVIIFKIAKVHNYSIMVNSLNSSSIMGCIKTKIDYNYKD